MRCQECGKSLTNEEDCYGHDCEVFAKKEQMKAKEKESKEWIHREQQGKVRGVQRLGFKPVNKKRSFW